MCIGVQCIGYIRYQCIGYIRYISSKDTWEDMGGGAGQLAPAAAGRQAGGDVGGEGEEGEGDPNMLYIK
jgi:hypothetical protein